MDPRALVAVELFGELLDQAKRLNVEGCHAAAASLAGAVLEATLRRLCQVHGLSMPEKAGLERLNGDLARAGAYDRPAQQRIAALAEIRDRADHGHSDRVRREDVEEMVKWVRRFAFRHVGRREPGR